MPPYTLRTSCLICKSSNLTSILGPDTETSLSLGMYDTVYSNACFVPYNVLRCGNCKTYQTKYLGDLKLVYAKNHVDAFGSVKTNMHSRFTKFITKNTDITGIIEVGPATDILANEILNDANRTLPYSVVDPDFNGDRSRVKVYDTFIEDIDFDRVEGNTVVMSNLFEHLYHPMDVIDKIQRHSNNKYIYLNHPNFDHACKNDMYVLLNIEHIFYIENDFVIKMFNRFGYTCVEKENYETHTLLFKFERTHDPLDLPIENVSSDSDISRYFERMNSRVAVINKLLQETSNKVFMWPASIHTTALFTGGLDYTKLSGLLDNSPTKIGKFFYGYNLECFSLKDIMNTCDKNTTIILGGSDCYLKELKLNTTNATIIYLKDL